MDGVNDLGLSCFRAHVLIIFRMNNARLFCCHLYYFFYINCGCNICTTMTYEYTYSLHLFLTSCIF